jgi:hypothetical protein
MNLRFFQFLFLSFFSSITLFAQFSETISSDRPGQSNSPNSLGKMVLQIQTGLQVDGASNDYFKSNGFSWPAMVRFGIAEKVDLITVWGYQSGKLKSKINDWEFTANGINSADFGLRFNIFEETDKAPALGFEAYYKTEIASEDFKPDYPSARLNLMASKGFTDVFSVTTNLGLDVDGSGGGSNGFYTLNFVFAVSDEISLFVENYGNFTYESFDTYFDFGSGYLLNNDLQLDLLVGLGKNDEVFRYFVSGGISYRITKWRKHE